MFTNDALPVSMGTVAFGFSRMVNMDLDSVWIFSAAGNLCAESIFVYLLNIIL